MVYSLFQLPVNESLKKCCKKAVNQKYTKPTCCETRTPSFDSNKSSPRLSHLYFISMSIWSVKCNARSTTNKKRVWVQMILLHSSRQPSVKCVCKLKVRVSGAFFPTGRPDIWTTTPKNCYSSPKSNWIHVLSPWDPTKTLNISNPATKNNILLMVQKKTNNHPDVFETLWIMVDIYQAQLVFSPDFWCHQQDDPHPTFPSTTFNPFPA